MTQGPMHRKGRASQGVGGGVMAQASITRARRTRVEGPGEGKDQAKARTRRGEGPGDGKDQASPDITRVRAGDPPSPPGGAQTSQGGGCRREGGVEPPPPPPLPRAPNRHRERPAATVGGHTRHKGRASYGAGPGVRAQASHGKGVARGEGRQGEGPDARVQPLQPEGPRRDTPPTPTHPHPPAEDPPRGGPRRDSWTP